MISLSHITTIQSTIALKNEGYIKNAITNMAKEFQGMKFEQTAPNVIKVRYAPIEGYQKNGNIQFIKDKAGVWQMQLDHYRCADEVDRVKEAFFVAYQEVAINAGLKARGYRVVTKKEGKNLIMTAVKY
jgi:hypothetical protein